MSRLAQERDWHDKHFSGRELVVEPKVVERYLRPYRVAPLFPREYLFYRMGKVTGKSVLCFGCGDDCLPHLLAMMGAAVTAFDLSGSACAVQAKMGKANATEVRLAQAAAEHLPFATASFDLIVGTMILHHLPDALGGVPEELRRILKPGGRSLFIEPISFSRSLAKVRRHVPIHTKLSPGERQLTEADLQGFSGRREYFRLLSRLDRITLPSQKLETAAAWRQWVTKVLYAADRVLLRIKPIQKYAGTVVIEC